MTENPLYDTSLCMEKHQLLGVLRKNQLWRSLLVRMSTIAVSMCVCQAIWLINLMKELCIEGYGVVTLMIDNVSTINLIKNPIAHERSKHIDMRFYYLRELVSEGKLKLGYFKSENQMVDLLTNVMSIEVLKKLKKIHE